MSRVPTQLQGSRLATGCSRSREAEHFYRAWSVAKTPAPTVNARCSALLPDTRNYKVVRGGEKKRMKIHAGLFSIFLSTLLPVIISAFNSCTALKQEGVGREGVSWRLFDASNEAVLHS